MVPAVWIIRYGDHTMAYTMYSIHLKFSYDTFKLGHFAIFSSKRSQMAGIARTVLYDPYWPYLSKTASYFRREKIVFYKKNLEILAEGFFLGVPLKMKLF